MDETINRHGLALAAPLAVLGAPAVAMTGIALWGVGVGAQAPVMRAAFAPLAPPI